MTEKQYQEISIVFALTTNAEEAQKLLDKKGIKISFPTEPKSFEVLGEDKEDYPDFHEHH